MGSNDASTQRTCFGGDRRPDERSPQNEESHFPRLRSGSGRDSSDRSLDEFDHGVDRLACRDDETVASFDKGD